MATVTIFDPGSVVQVIVGNPPVDQTAEVATLTAQVASLTAANNALTTQVATLTATNNAQAAKIATALVDAQKVVTDLS